MPESYPNISTSAVVGIDGHSPIYEPEGRWCFWSLNEIYVGQIAAGKYVPKVNDYVIDPETFTTWIVRHIDPVTLIAQMEIKRPANMVYEFTEQDILFGVGPGAPANTYRIYLDKTVTPHVLAVDIRAYIPGSGTSYAKLFKGSDLSGAGEVISRLYDNSGNLLSDRIPLETVAIDNHTNYHIKTVAVCYTNYDLNDGEIVTLVVYSDAGHVVYKRQFLIENTGFIRSVNISQKYVSHINLESPFLSPTLDNIIEFPLNLPVSSLSLTGVVNYSDGSNTKLPIDNAKFKLFGINQFSPTIIGQHLELVLGYNLAADEVAYGVPVINNNMITEAYDVVVINPNNSIMVKLFCYPMWISQELGYELSWWLFNLDRDICINVTPYVLLDESTGAFNPKAYGYLQSKLAKINLRDAVGSFPAVVYTQMVNIVLRTRPTGLETPWTVLNEVLPGRAAYGEDLLAVKQPRPVGIEFDSFKIDCGLGTKALWLEKLYKNTYPLYDNNVEANPPIPTHFEIIYNTTKIEYLIDEWNSTLTFGTIIPNYKTIFIRFFRRIASIEQNLAIAALLVSQ